MQKNHSCFSLNLSFKNANVFFKTTLSIALLILAPLTACVSTGNSYRLKIGDRQIGHNRKATHRYRPIHKCGPIRLCAGVSFCYYLYMLAFLPLAGEAPLNYSNLIQGPYNDRRGLAAFSQLQAHLSSGSLGSVSSELDKLKKLRDFEFDFNDRVLNIKASADTKTEPQVAANWIENSSF